MRTNFRIVNSCDTCKHCSKYQFYEDNEWYCNIENLLSAKAVFSGTPTEKLTDEEFEVFSKWIRDNEVSATNICDSFEVESKDGT